MSEKKFIRLAKCLSAASSQLPAPAGHPLACWTLALSYSHLDLLGCQWLYWLKKEPTLYKSQQFLFGGTVLALREAWTRLRRCHMNYSEGLASSPKSWHCTSGVICASGSIPGAMATAADI